uniref:Glycoprotein n=1 Tax=Soybean cyst nematode nyami-like virus TaxID=2107712 RepID=A0A2P1CXV4_9MONO|nr:glycoprotein [Soybean cyst nematode nyami-like virus]
MSHKTASLMMMWLSFTFWTIWASGIATATLPNDYAALICAKKPTTILQLPPSTCPPTYTESRQVKGVMLDLNPFSHPLLATRVCKVERTCSIFDQSRPFGHIYPGPPIITNKPVPLSEYEAKVHLTDLTEHPTGWQQQGEEAVSNDPCQKIQLSETGIGENSGSVVSVKKIQTQVRQEQTRTGRVINTGLGSHCDYLEGECQDKHGCWLLWTPAPSAQNWRTGVADVEGVLYLQPDGRAYFHSANLSWSYHVRETQRDGTPIWMTDDGDNAFILIEKPGARGKRAIEHTQLALDLGNIANARLNWLCDDKMGAALWHLAAWQSAPTAVARSLLKRDDVHAEACGLGCLVIYDCVKITAIKVIETTECYLHPRITYRLPSETREIEGHVDTTNQLILSMSPEVACETGPLRYMRLDTGTLLIIYPGGKTEMRAIDASPKAAALNPVLMTLVSPLPNQLWDPSQVNPLATGISQLRTALSQWTGADHLSPREVEEAMENRARERALNLNPDAGWIGAVGTALEWTSWLICAATGSRWLSFIVTMSVDALKRRYLTQPRPEAPESAETGV